MTRLEKTPHQNHQEHDSTQNLSSPLLTRRDFTRAALLTLGTCALGFSTLAVGGCSSSSGKAVLRVSDQSFYLNGSTKGVTFDGAKLSLVANVSSNCVELHYDDAQDEKQVEKICNLGEEVNIEGSLGLLCIDGAGNNTEPTGRYNIAQDAVIEVLGVGNLADLHIQGSVDCLLMVGNTDVTVEKDSQVTFAALGDSSGKLQAESGSKIALASTPSDSQISGEGASTISISKTGDTQLIDRIHAVYLDASDSSEEWEARLNPTEAALIEKLSNNEAADLAVFESTTLAANSAASSAAATAEAIVQDADASQEGPEEDLEVLTEVNAIDGETSETLSAGDFVSNAATSGPSLPNSSSMSTSQVIESLMLEGLKSAAGAAGSTAGEWGMHKIYEWVFGSQEDKTAEIINALNEITTRLSEIEDGIGKILNKLRTMEYSTQVDNYLQTYSIPAQTTLDFIDNKMAIIDAMENGEEKAAAQRTFAEELYAGSGNYSINGNSIFKHAALMADEICLHYSSTGVDLLGAYDELMLYTYKWEHQGYDERLNFHNYVLDPFVRLASLSSFCLQEHLDAYRSDPTGDEFTNALASWQTLFGNPANMLKAMGVNSNRLNNTNSANNADNNLNPQGKATLLADLYEIQKVNIRPDTERYYQVEGHEVLLAATAYNLSTSKNGGTKQSQFMHDSEDHGVVYQQQLENIIADYGGKTPLSEILFNEAEGNIAKPSDMNADYICYAQPLIKETHSSHPGNKRYYEFYAPMLTDKGKSTRKELAYISSQNKTTIYSAKGIGVFRL